MYSMTTRICPVIYSLVCELSHSKTVIFLHIIHQGGATQNKKEVILSLRALSFSVIVSPRFFLWCSIHRNNVIKVLANRMMSGCVFFLSPFISPSFALYLL